MFKSVEIRFLEWLLLLCTLTVNISEGREIPVDVHGFISQGFFASSKYNLLSEDSRKGSWELREVGINFQKSLLNRFRIGMQFISRDVGMYGNNKIALDWAYGNTIINRYLNISVGRTKNELGFYSSVQDFDFLTPYVFLPSVIYDKGLRTLTSSTDGLKLNGNTDISRVGNLEYSLSVGKLDLSKESDIGTWAKTIGLNSDEMTTDIIVTSNLLYTSPYSAVKFHFSTLTMGGLEFTVMSPNKLIEVKENLHWLYFGFMLDKKFLNLTAEWHHRFYSNSRKKLTVFDSLGTAVFKKDVSDTLNRGGGYLGVLLKPLSWLTVGGYYQMYWDRYDDHDILSGLPINTALPTNLSRDGALSLGFNISNTVVIKLEGHLVYGMAAPLTKEINADALDTQGNFKNGNYWQYGVINVSYSF